MHTNHYPVTLVGRAARNALHSMIGGQVIAVFRRSFYVETDGSELMCFGAPAIGAGPLNALCELPQEYASDSLELGVRVERRGDELRLGADIGLTLETATLWQPVVGAAPRAHDTLRNALAEVAELVAQRVNACGFGAFVPALLGGDGKPRINTDDVLLTCSWGIVHAFTHWLQEILRGRGSAVVPEKARALVGLGPGLTPSGDDFLAGVMIALRWLGNDALAKRIAAWTLPLARTRTNKISRAHLQCAADGQGAAALHALLTVCSSVECGDLTAHVDALDDIGHTSGWDAFAGVVCACAATINSGTGSRTLAEH